MTVAAELFLVGPASVIYEDGPRNGDALATDCYATGNRKLSTNAPRWKMAPVTPGLNELNASIRRRLLAFSDHGSSIQA